MIASPFTASELKQMYEVECLSIEKIGQEAITRLGGSIAKNTARKWLITAGIPIRPNGRDKQISPDRKCPACGKQKSVSIVMCFACWQHLPLVSQMTVFALFTKDAKSEEFEEALEVAVDIVRAVSEKKPRKGFTDGTCKNTPPPQFKDLPRGAYAANTTTQRRNEHDKQTD